MTNATITATIEVRGKYCGYTKVNATAKFLANIQEFKPMSSSHNSIPIAWAGAASAETFKFGEFYSLTVVKDGVHGWLATAATPSA